MTGIESEEAGSTAGAKSLLDSKMAANVGFKSGTLESTAFFKVA